MPSAGEEGQTHSYAVWSNTHNKGTDVLQKFSTTFMWTSRHTCQDVRKDIQDEDNICHDQRYMKYRDLKKSCRIWFW